MERIWHDGHFWDGQSADNIEKILADNKQCKLRIKKIAMTDA